MAIEDDRIHVILSEQSLGVTLTLGDIVVTAKLPATPGLRDMPTEQVRAHALRQARRVFEVATQELSGH